MTYVISNEADTIEQSIRFHHAMGVDGFIVSSHNSKDETDNILERLKSEGLVWEIIYRHTPDHRHSEWVTEMVRLAKCKYHADWVINADGDEFYYSDQLDLKKSILECGGANSLWVKSWYVFPTEEDNCFKNAYYITRPLQEFEAKQNGVLANPVFSPYIGSNGCGKVIFRTHGFLRAYDGNHSVGMLFERKCRVAGIRLYHQNIRNYAGLEAKVRRWHDSARLMPEGMGQHMKDLLQMYENRTLRAYYEGRFNSVLLNRLIDMGVVTYDPSVLNFMKWKGLL